MAYRGLLEDAGWQDLEGIAVERKVYLVRCDTALLDFRTKKGPHTALIDPESYHLTHQIGARINNDGHPGLISRSARCGGNVYAVFNPKVLSSPRQVCYLTFGLALSSSIAFTLQPYSNVPKGIPMLSTHKRPVLIANGYR